jgi:hypothetical protein
MSVQKIWDAKLERWIWVDLSYILEKKDVPDPRHGQLVGQQPPRPKQEEEEKKEAP